MLTRFSFAFFVVVIFLQSVCLANPPFKVVLKNGEVLVLEMVEETNADVSSDLRLGLAAFESAFVRASDEEIVAHFGPDRDIRGYYRRLLHNDDVVPFHDGELIWIRAFLNQELVGWMTLVPGLRGPGTVYVSTLVVDPSFHNLGIGTQMLASIRAHWVLETTEVDIIVRRINYEALPFYDRLGFVRAPDMEADMVDDPSRCIAMRLLGPRLFRLVPREDLEQPLTAPRPIEDINAGIIADVLSRGFDSL